MNRKLKTAIPLLLAAVCLAAGPVLAANGRATLAAGDGLSDGTAHVLVIGEGNTLWAWGANAAGQLGDGSTTLRRAPVRVGSSADWAYVAAGSAHSLAIKTDGSLWAWGDNSKGQLGTGISASSGVPVRVAANILVSGQPVRWIAVAAAANYSVAITEAGSLYIWGEYPDFRVEFSGDIYGQSNAPVRIGSVSDTWFGVDAGMAHVLALRGAPGSSAGRLFAWGLNTSGQIGLGSTSTRQPIVEVPLSGTDTVSDWSMISAGVNNSFAIRGGSLYGWGASSQGKLGIANIDPFNPPYRPTLVGTGFTQVFAATTHTLARKGDQLWGWGSNATGQLGIERFTSGGAIIPGSDQRATPVSLSPSSGVTAAAAGLGFSVALRNGVIVSAGANESGQLGDDTTVDRRYTFTEAAFGFPDLRITQVRAVPPNFVPGDTVTIEVTLANEGSGAVPAGSGAVVGARLAPAPEWESGNVILNDNIPITNRIGPGQTGVATASVTIPGDLITGTYFIVARADRTNVIAEINELNNDGAAAESYHFLPDLTVEAANIEFAAGLDLNRQDELTVTVVVSNVGEVNLPAGSNVQGLVVLTKDSTLGNADDVVLAPFTITGAIPRLISGVPGVSAPIAVTAPIPGSANPGTYFVGVIVDDANVLEEITKENNMRVRTNQTLLVSEASAIPLHTAVDLTFQDFTDPFFNTPDPFVAPPITFSGSASWYGIDADLPPGVTDGDVGRTPVLNNPGETATFGLELKGPLRVTFRWSIQSEADEVRFTMDGAVMAAIDGDEDWREVEVIIPGANPPRRLEWTYIRNSTRAADPDAVVYLDNMTLTGINLPDMIVTQLDYNSTGTEVFVIGRDTPLDIQIVGINQGVPVPESMLPASNQFEVEVRLSRDRIWGNGDDYILGRLDELERLGASQRFVYGRVVDLDDCALPSGDYYIGVKVDAGGLYTEYDEENNIRWSEAPDIRIEQRPQLRVTNLQYIPGIYYRQQELPARFKLTNVGCEDVLPGVELETEVRLIGYVYDFSVNVNAGMTVTATRQPLLERVLATISDSNGIRAGESAEFIASFQIPRYMERELFPIYHPAKITYGPADIINRFPDFTIEVDDTTVPTGFPAPIYGTNVGNERNPVFFYFEFETTGDLPLVEDIIVQTFGSGEVVVDSYNDPAYNGIGILILQTPQAETYDAFAAKYPLPGGSADDFDGDGYTNFQEFAFVSDPRFSRFDGAHASTQGSPAVGLVDISLPVDGQMETHTFMSAAFNMLSQWSNGAGISYVVEFANDAGFTSVVNAVTLPAGADHDALREIPGVVSVTNNGYSYRVLVRDVVPASGLTSRFARVRLVTP